MSEKFLQENEQELDIDLSELVGESDITNTLPPIELDMEDFDIDEFERGISDTSYDAGVITTLLNTGVTEGFVLDYLLNKATIDHNIQLAKLNNETQIQISKNQKIALDKQEL